MKRLTLLLLVLLLIIPTAPAAAQNEVTSEPPTLPDEVVFEAPVPGLLPEGVEWDAERGEFLIGSLAIGTIHAVADDGTLTERFSDQQLASTIGIHIADGQLYVANSLAEVFGNPSAVGMASLAIFDLETGELVSFTDMTDVFEADGAHFANDVTADAEGNAYVTDSFKPVIYRVTAEGDASAFVTSDLLAAQGFGLNGIDYHPDGYLLAAVAGNGTIVKIPLDDPASLAPVAMDESVSIDGMALGSDGVLYAAGTAGPAGAQEIVAIASEDDWETAEVIARTPTSGDATTLALRHSAEGEAPAVFYVNTYFGQSDRTEYEIVRAPLELDDAMSE